VVFLFLNAVHSFLKTYVEYHSQNFNNQDTLIVLPSKRAVTFLKNEFKPLKESLWLPEIVDIVSLVETIARHRIIDQNESLLLFYQSYTSVLESQDKDSFEKFCSWAPQLLSDFNELDRFLIDTDSFFKYHKELKELSYFGQEKTELVKSYIKFWEDLPKLYNEFRSQLESRGMAYQGLAYRKAFENLHVYLEENTKTHVFLGFNALNKAEENIIETLLNNDQAKVIWDIDTFYLKEQQHPSKLFIDQYLKLWDKYKDKLIYFKDQNFETPKTFQFISSTKQLGMCKAVSQILQQLGEDQLNSTALVLNDEELLTPILNSIPEHVEKVNITMGLPLSYSPFSEVFEFLMAHQKLQKDSIHAKQLLKLISSSIFAGGQVLISQLLEMDKRFITYEDIIKLHPKAASLKQLFECLKRYEAPEDFIQSLHQLIKELLASLSTRLTPFLNGYSTILDRLHNTLQEYPGLTIKDMCYLFSTYERDEKLSFKGTQTEGLQIMGMLETRLLDYKNVIMLSVNEGVIPSGKTDNSFVTYTQKKQYGLPTHKDKDAVYAYHFFRLLQRSENCYFIYDDDKSGFNKGEMSRFAKYLQIFKLPQHTQSSEVFLLPTQINTKEKGVIRKTDSILQKLKTLAQSGFSPTALTTYIENPIRFYKRYVLGVREEQEIEDELNHREFGTIVHDTLEYLYSGLKTPLSEEDIADFNLRKEEVLKLNFDKIYAKEAYLKGSNRLKYEIASASISQFLAKEKQHLKKHRITILALEKEVQTTLKTTFHEVKLKGKIDRIDKCNGNRIRIIDYKTGNVVPSDLTIKEWEEVIENYEYSKVFQTLFYALVYSKTAQIDQLEAGIISLKNLNNWFMPVKKGKQLVIDAQLLHEFETYLVQLIDEILDPEMPFVEKESTYN